MVNGQILHFSINTCDPRRELWGAICKYVVNRKVEWLPCYEEVAKWLADNDSRGLLCVGSSGLGKSVVCMYALPFLFKRHFDLDVMAVSSTEMNQRIDELLAYCGNRRVIIIDDVGEEAYSVFGRHPFCELVNVAERTGTLLIITTNLRTTADKDPARNYPSIEARYGVPTLDRLRAITRVAVFRGESFRGK